MKNSKSLPLLALLLLFAAVIALAVQSGWLSKESFTISGVQSHVFEIRGVYNQNPFVGIVFFSLLFVVLISFSIPVGNVFCIVAGAIFGSGLGCLLSTVALCLGATFGMLIARTFFKPYATKKLEKMFGEKYLDAKERIDANAFLFVVGLRLSMVVPFAIINFMMGMTRIKPSSFFLGSVIGLLPTIYLFVEAGSTLATIQSLSEIITMKTFVILFSIAALVFASILSKKYLKSFDLKT